jgi:hypothetical protein
MAHGPEHPRAIAVEQGVLGSVWASQRVGQSIEWSVVTESIKPSRGSVLAWLGY